MDVSELREHKLRMEKEIIAAIDKFRSATGFDLMAVDMRFDRVSQAKNRYVTIKPILDL